ncbi:MAG: peroxiredoxin [Halopseudomonas sp.]|uniref:peroxiredoxin n=1 Tax=Halopseudomonas sp. TaxID=2901191 RepID=UPI0030030DDD
MQVEINQPLPPFNASATGEQSISPDTLAGQKVVLYFYPKDNTPGCTTEGQDFRDQFDAFSAAGAVIYGVSRDSLRTHSNFKAKHEFPFELISDPEEELCKLFDVIKLKKLYGKEYEGIERSTFLVDAKGVLRQEWRKVKVPGHVAEVLAAVQALD